MKSVFWILTLVSALGCGLVAGVFFGFSTFVMKALGRRPPPEGIAAMQSINVVVINSVFLGVFLGTGLTCLLVAVLSLLRWQEPGAAQRLVGSALYLAGTIGVTIFFNVPRNDALARVEPASAEGERVWSNYLREWTAWNHVRTAAALAAAVLLTIAL